MEQRYCLALDLKDEAAAISRYEDLHAKVSAPVIASIRDADILEMEIFRTGNRLFMIMETGPAFSFEAKGKSDASNPAVQEWEDLVGQYQQLLPWAKPGEKWVLMHSVFRLSNFEQ